MTRASRSPFLRSLAAHSGLLALHSQSSSLFHRKWPYLLLSRFFGLLLASQKLGAQGPHLFETVHFHLSRYNPLKETLDFLHFRVLSCTSLDKSYIANVFEEARFCCRLPARRRGTRTSRSPRPYCMTFCVESQVDH